MPAIYQRPVPAIYPDRQVPVAYIDRCQPSISSSNTTCQLSDRCQPYFERCLHIRGWSHQGSHQVPAKGHTRCQPHLVNWVPVIELGASHILGHILGRRAIFWAVGRRDLRSTRVSPSLRSPHSWPRCMGAVKENARGRQASGTTPDFKKQRIGHTFFKNSIFLVRKSRPFVQVHWLSRCQPPMACPPMACPFPGNRPICCQCGSRTRGGSDASNTTM